MFPQSRTYRFLTIIIKTALTIGSSSLWTFSISKLFENLIYSENGEEVSWKLTFPLEVSKFTFDCYRDIIRDLGIQINLIRHKTYGFPFVDAKYSITSWIINKKKSRFEGFMCLRLTPDTDLVLFVNMIAKLHVKHCNPTWKISFQKAINY